MKKYHDIVGKDIKRVDAVAKVLGTAKFSGDFSKDGAVIGKALYAQYPHAKIIRIDTSQAEKLDGVLTIMTAKDLPGRNGYGAIVPDKPVIADSKTRYAGDPVALVAALNEKIALQALKLIKVEYQVLPVYDDPREAMKDEALNIHENHPCADKGNILTVVSLDRGDVDHAFAEADLIVENDYETPMVDQAYLEPDICIAEYDPLTGGLILISPQQGVYATKRSLAPVFGLPQSKIKVVSPIVGGGFGGKEDSTLDVCAAAGVLALQTKSKVYFELSREEVFRTTNKRHPAYIKHRIAATKDGRITAIDVTTVLDKGAYVSLGGLRDPFNAVTQRTVAYAGGTYAIPNARVKSYSVFTNHPYSGAFRGFGVPQANFAIESQLDELAAKLKMDPIEIRLKNILRHGDRAIFGQVMQESRGLGLEECIEKVRSKMNWTRELAPVNSLIKRGRGIAVFMYGTGIPLSLEGANCYATLQTDGSLTVNVAVTEMGQGIITALSQLAAETVGINIDDVLIRYSDTEAAPDCGATVASRSATMIGNAVVDACQKLRKRMISTGALILNSDPGEIDIRSGKVMIKGKPQTAVPLAAVVGKAYASQVSLSVVGSWYPPMPSFSSKDGQGDLNHAFTFGAHGVEIEVDTETGVINVTKSVLACDVGKAINPVNVEGQMEGGVAQAIGWSLMEEHFMNEGIMENASFHNFLIPTIKDLPLLESIIVEHPNELGPYGAKGIGEPPILAAAPAIRNALYNATGIKLNVIPLTPQRVLQAIRGNKGAE